MDTEKIEILKQRKRTEFLDGCERGQISLMIGLMVGTFVLIFLFVINAGILINARINLQNAADMAAYAGAATQARQLNLISMLNYEMRRQYKKFLFRYYVMGGWGYDDSPQRAGTDQGQDRRYRTGFLDPSGRPSGAQGTVLNVPVTCFDLRYIVDAQGRAKPESVCRVIDFKAVATPPDLTGVFGQVIGAQASAINSIIEHNCGGLALRNLEVLNKWLWNIDPSFELLKSELEQAKNTPGPQRQIAEEKLRGLSQLANITRGIGLYPMNLFLLSRIEQIEEYINQPANRVDLSVVKGMETSSDPFKNERTIQAFYSAYRSLGEHTFSNESDIVLEEILPNRLIDLEVGRADFTVFPLIYVRGNSGNACQAIVFPLPVLGLPVAVSKKPSTMTYYAVRLRGRARLLLPPGLFSSDEFEMVSYSAAQPFGSRIGPLNAQQLAETEFRKAIDFSSVLGVDPSLTTGLRLPSYIPWLPVQNAQSGWEKAEFQKALYESGVLSIGDQALQNSLHDLSGFQLEQAYEVAMMPNPVESGRYNIMHWPQMLESGRPIEVFDRRFVPHLVKIDPPVTGSSADTPPSGSQRLVPGTLQTLAAAYWSPLANLSGGVDINGILSLMDKNIEEFREKTTLYIRQKTGGGAGAGGVNFEATMNQLIDQLKKQMPQFLRNLDRFVDETGQGLTYQVFRTPFPPFGDKIAQRYPQYFMTTPLQIRTSWVNQRHRRITESGRSGYSVKFVSFDYLQRRPTNAAGGGAQGAGPWTNGLIDSELTALTSASPPKH